LDIDKKKMNTLEKDYIKWKECFNIEVSCGYRNGIYDVESVKK